MEEVCTCIGCGGQRWAIYRNRMECYECGKTYFWPLDCPNEDATKAQDLLNLTREDY